jgi:hypothetical protein
MAARSDSARTGARAAQGAAGRDANAGTVKWALARVASFDAIPVVNHSNCGVINKTSHKARQHCGCAAKSGRHNIYCAMVPAPIAQCLLAIAASHKCSLDAVIAGALRRALASLR